MFSWKNSKLRIGDSQIGERGVFAVEDIAKDELLVVFGGFIFTLRQESRLPARIRDYAHQIAPDFVMGVNKTTDIQSVDYINHSCEPNAGFRGQLFLVAMRKIKSGEEITFDYGMILMEPSDKKIPYALHCMCGKKACRGIVTDKDWRKKGLQLRYKGYFQCFIQEKISGNKSPIYILPSDFNRR